MISYMKNKTITQNSIIQRSSKELITNTLGNELVMMDMENGDYIGINSAGTAIWAIIEKPISVTELVNELVKNYDVERELCEKQSIHYLQTMWQHGLITVK